MDELRQQLERWQAKRLISPEQAAAILADAAGRPEEGGAGGGAADAWAGRRRLGEALGYVGAVCAVTAGLLAAGQAWAHLGLLARSTLLLVTVTVLAAGGWWANGQRAASVRRLGAVLWFLAVAAVAGFAEVVADQVLHQSHGLQHVIAGLAATAAGVLFWRLRVSSLQQVAVLVSLLATVTAVGAVGLFVFLFDATLTWFGRGATVPLALLVTGGALLLVAVLTGRIRRSPATQDRRRGVPG